ncbi:hypothetical protein SKAU_G00082000 [Synaphobranchus kaupii]|uniref:Uncharacterized protein n=1 Tax=Synaphobranchus kaupii TaxID=118154 RepID=A0A9Q1FV42_SYNKA|nr:hypothetical protein SKAU_G00082000 [Synaphobranchus kaupii]
MKMLGCGCILLSCLLTVTLLHCGTDSLRITQDPSEYLDTAAMEESGVRARPGERKPGRGLPAKLLLLDRLQHGPEGETEESRGATEASERSHRSDRSGPASQRKGLGHAPSISACRPSSSRRNLRNDPEPPPVCSTGRET